MRIYGTIIHLSAIAILLGSCSVYQKNKYRVSDNRELKKTEKPGNVVRIYHVQTGALKMRVLVAGDTNLPVTLLIHGAPGSVARFNPLLSDTAFTKHHRFVAVDRPGYGYTNFGHADTSIQNQVNLILQAVKNFLPKNNFSVLGVSYGGPIAAAIAGTDTQRVNKLVLVSSAVGPGLEKIYGISYLIRKSAFRFIFPRFIRVANDEKLSHENSLCEITALYPNIHARLLMFHATDDRLIYFSNATYCKAVFKNVSDFELVSSHGNHHTFMWDNEVYFKQKLSAFLSQ